MTDFVEIVLTKFIKYLRDGGFGGLLLAFNLNCLFVGVFLCLN